MPLVVIGLGNPGEDYHQHRHNIGFHVVDRIACECGIRLKKPHFLSHYEAGTGRYQGQTIILAKPLTWMNRSGESVKSILRLAKAAAGDLLIVCDNLDLQTGSLKLKFKGSSGGHRGLESLFAVLKTNEVRRLTIGIGRPTRKGGVVDHVLGIPEKEEQAVLEDAVNRAALFILRLVKEPAERLMSEVNRRVKNDDHTQG